MNPPQEIEQDILLLRMLLRILASDPELQVHEMYLESLNARLVLLDTSASDELKSFINAPKMGERLAELLSRHAIEFVAQQVEELAKIRECREFTSTEERFGREILPNLLNTIKELI